MVEPTREYGYRDLGMIQDFRRRYLEPTFSRHTNDLAMALRLYELRHQFTTNDLISAELDHVFTNLITGKIEEASLQMNHLGKAPAK